MPTFKIFIEFVTTNGPLPSLKRPFKIATFYHTLWKLISIIIIIIIIIIVLAILTQSGRNVANAEYFSSVDSLKKLGDVEMGLVQVFQVYLKAQERELESYRSFIENVKLQQRLANKNIDDYFSNPISAFTLVKRMVTDWSNLSELIKQSRARNGFRQNLQEFSEVKDIPDESELKGAVGGLLRLQKVYNLSAQDLANGEINGVYTDIELTWHDCFEIGANLFDQKELESALSWLQIALNKFDEPDSKTKNDATHCRFEIEILEYLALTNYELGNSQKAIEYIDKILNVSSNHHTKKLRHYIMNTPQKKHQLSDTTDQHTLFHNYTRLCQGIQIPQKRLRRLKCTVESRGNPYFILAPLKVEHLNRDPQIRLYHGLLTDVQIDRIIDEAEGNMRRSLVKSNSSDKVSDVRVSQQAWLLYTSPVMKSIYWLVGQITGLDLTNAEGMQMANYGIGGQFDPHNDFFGPEYNSSHYSGDRIETNMFYLSDVEQGGLTVFPKINVLARPVKGSMVSWYNLHKSLEGDYRTLHAGCPVIRGSKRIGNIWIHSGFQEFKRPCGLENDAYQSADLR